MYPTRVRFKREHSAVLVKVAEELGITISTVSAVVDGGSSVRVQQALEREFRAAGIDWAWEPRWQRQQRAREGAPQ
jgi:hypothetical protein